MVTTVMTYDYDPMTTTTFCMTQTIQSHIPFLNGSEIPTLDSILVQRYQDEDSIHCTVPMVNYMQ